MKIIMNTSVRSEKLFTQSLTPWEKKIKMILIRFARIDLRGKRLLKCVRSYSYVYLFHIRLSLLNTAPRRRSYHVRQAKLGQKRTHIDLLRVHRSVRPSLCPFYSQNCLHILSKVSRSTARQLTQGVGSIRCRSSKIQKNFQIILNL